MVRPILSRPAAAPTAAVRFPAVPAATAAGFGAPARLHASSRSETPSKSPVMRPRKRLPFPISIPRFSVPARAHARNQPRAGMPEGMCPCVGAQPVVPWRAMKASISSRAICFFITAIAAIILRFARVTLPAPAASVISGFCSSGA